MRFPTLLLAVLVGAGGAAAQNDRDFLREDVLGALPWRALGPSTFGGRIVDVEVDPERTGVWWVASATGGLWKTEDAGTTFEELLADVPIISIGDIAIAPSNPDVVYVGTGEANNQRSSYHGDGIYKSNDGGRTWSHVGLRGTEHIGRVVVHPRNPDRVWVAALGALYTPNPDRGLYRTLDGGANWECVKHISADVGFVDVVIDPGDPDVLYAASYERRRRAWDFDESGPGSGIWKSTDGGVTWERLDGGLPSGEIGRIGLSLCTSAPSTVYAIVENRNPAPKQSKKDEVISTEPSRSAAPRDPYSRTEPTPDPFARADASEEADERPRRRKLIGGEVWRSDDGGETWQKRHDKPVGGSPHYYYGQVRVAPSDPERAVVLGVRAWHTADGGKTWKNDFQSRLHVDCHALWIDPHDVRHALIGNDGGLGVTHDGGETWRWIDHLPLAQFYAVGVDTRTPYTIYGGTQDNGSWAVPSHSTTREPVGHADTIRVGGGDGFYVAVDPENQDIVYSEAQFGALRRLDLRTGRTTSIRPRAPKGSPKLRFNWMSPLVVSQHDPQTIYFGSQYVHRSRNRGDDWEIVSSDLTSSDPDRLAGDVPHCTITTIDESPHDADHLLAGTDDGRVWLSRTGGSRWVELTDRFDGVRPRLWVSRVSWSPSDAETAYVAFTGYREDLRDPHVFITTDGGESFRSIANDLPQACVNVVREHPRNASVLFVGHEFGVAVSIDGGGTWHPIGSGLPTVPVHDLLVHPREEDLVIGTHGRGLWVLDITPLAELDDSVIGKSFHAFRPRDGRRVAPTYRPKRYPATPGWTADRAPTGALFRYYLREESDEPVTITVRDATDRVWFEHEGDTGAGLHTVEWSSLRQRGRRRPRAPRAGEYAVVFDHGEDRAVFSFRIRAAPIEADGGATDGAGSAPRRREY